VSHTGYGGVSRDDGRTAIRDDRVRAPRGDLSLSATRDLPGDRGRGPVAGDVSASLSRLPNARPGRERPGLALRHRDQFEPESLSIRDTAARRPSGGGGGTPRGGTRRPRGRGPIRRGANVAREHGAGLAPQAAAGLRDAQGPRPRLRGHWPEPRLLVGQRAGARVPGAPQDSPE